MEAGRREVTLPWRRRRGVTWRRRRRRRRRRRGVTLPELGLAPDKEAANQRIRLRV